MLSTCICTCNAGASIPASLLGQRKFSLLVFSQTVLVFQFCSQMLSHINPHIRACTFWVKKSVNRIKYQYVIDVLSIFESQDYDILRCLVLAVTYVGRTLFYTRPSISCRPGPTQGLTQNFAGNNIYSHGDTVLRARGKQK